MKHGIRAAESFYFRTLVRSAQNNNRKFSTDKLPIHPPKVSNFNNAESRVNNKHAIVTFPFIEKIPHDTQKAEELFANINQGISAEESIKQYFSSPGWATNSFLKRMAFAPSLESIELLGTLLANDLKVNGQFDGISYARRVKNIPYPTEGAEIARVMWNIVEVVSNRYSKNTASRMIVNIGSEWQKNAIPTVGEYFPEGKYYNAITKDLFLPAYIAKLAESYAEQGKAVPNFEFSPYVLNNIADYLQPIIGEKIAAGLTPQKLASYTERWHLNQLAIASQRPVLSKLLHKSARISKSEWYPFMKDRQINGYDYKVLTNQYEISLEGEEMSHCVGGYAKVCKEDDWHVISGKSPKGERFTLCLSKNNNIFTMDNIVGPHSKPVSSEIKKAAKGLVQKLNSKKITTNQFSGAIEKDEPLETRVGFDPFNASERERIFHIYQEKRIIPKIWRDYPSLETLISDTGIGNVIDKKIAKRFPRTSAPEFTWQGFINQLFNPAKGRGIW